jgi:ABC-type dipeptide/oligopeptide/nickel transport system permease component
VLVFLIARVLPGDPCVAALGERATRAACQAFMERNGLNEPLPVQLWVYAQQILAGDLGDSIRFRIPVTDLIIQRLPTTIELSFYALLFAVSVGIPLGVIAAYRRNSPADIGTMGLANVGIATPVFVLGLVLGSVGRDAQSLLDTSGSIRDVLGATGADITDAYFAGVLLLAALIATGFSISSALRLGSEEGSGHSELLLSAALPRVRWAAGHLAIAFAGTAVILAATGLGAGIGMQDLGQVPRLMGAALAQLPAAWVLGGIAAVLFGLAPQALKLTWAALGVCYLLWFLGPLLNLPRLVIDLSPYEHVPQLPAASFAAGPLLVLTAIAAALTAAGLIAFRRRDAA